MGIINGQWQASWGQVPELLLAGQSSCTQAYNKAHPASRQNTVSASEAYHRLIWDGAPFSPSSGTSLPQKANIRYTRVSPHGLLSLASTLSVLCSNLAHSAGPCGTWHHSMVSGTREEFISWTKQPKSFRTFVRERSVVGADIF